MVLPLPSAPGGRCRAGVVESVTNKNDDASLCGISHRIIEGPNGCSGRIKREAGGIVEDGDTLTSMPLKIGVEAVQPGPGTQPELAGLLAAELRAALDSFPQFQVANEPQLTATGRISGPRGRRSVDLQVIDRSGVVVQKVSVQASF